MTDGGFVVRPKGLFFGDEPLLDGDAATLAQFADVLNAAQPADERIAPTLRALIRGTWKDGLSFAPGSRLLSDGTAMINHSARGRAK